MSKFVEELPGRKAIGFRPDPAVQKVVEPPQWIDLHICQRIAISDPADVLKPLGYRIDRLPQHAVFETHHIPQLDQ